jgi:uncharacterized phage protein (TIGR01671 family)
MREILFRGKTKEHGIWAEGAYYKQTEFYGDPCEYHYIISSVDALEDNMMFCDRVIPETVGQYTGLTDKNGKKIFEGDILKIARVSDSTGSYYFPPLVYPVNVIVKWDMCAWMWETLCEDKRYIGFPDAWCHYECEVIGNIHDNPELLEVQK